MGDTTLNLFDRYVKPKPPKVVRPPWRPKTRTPEHYAALLQKHRELTVWFETKFNRPHESDTELIKAHLAEEYQKAGQRAGRAEGTEAAGKIKTILNELAAARQLFPLSRKGALQRSEGGR